jgi:hypothetical protein
MKIYVYRKRPHFCIGDLDTLLNLSLHLPGANTQTCTGSGRTSVLEDGLETIQWKACPVFAEFTEQAMLNRIPLRRSGWIMSDGNGKAMSIAQAMPETVLYWADENPPKRSLVIAPVFVPHLER